MSLKPVGLEVVMWLNQSFGNSFFSICGDDWGMISSIFRETHVRCRARSSSFSGARSQIHCDNDTTRMGQKLPIGSYYMLLYMNDEHSFAIHFAILG